jgi:hypothetical protein
VAELLRMVAKGRRWRNYSKWCEDACGGGTTPNGGEGGDEGHVYGEGSEEGGEDDTLINPKPYTEREARRGRAQLRGGARLPGRVSANATNTRRSHSANTKNTVQPTQQTIQWRWRNYFEWWRWRWRNYFKLYALLRAKERGW